MHKEKESFRKEMLLFRRNGCYLLQDKFSSYENGKIAKLFTI